MTDPSFQPLSGAALPAAGSAPKAPLHAAHPPLASACEAPGNLRLPPIVREARSALARGREKLRRQHESGSPAMQVCAHWTQIVEEVVVGLYRAALASQAAEGRIDGQRLALVAHSGLGRRAMAPYSDVDLMLLYPDGAREALTGLVRQFSQWLYDSGLLVGFAARGVAEACQLALTDATILTGLIETRWLEGNTLLVAQFERRLARLVRRRSAALLAMVEEARREEQARYGETVFLLEPNVKRSRGGLRDLQFIRWVGYLRLGQRDDDALAQAGHLTRDELNQLRQAQDFLLWVRNDLHFFHGKAEDVLDREQQVRLAQRRGYRGSEGLLPVEQFMQEYFQHTSQVQQIASHLLETARPRRWWWPWVQPLVSHQFEGDFRVGPTTIWATRRGRARLRGNLAQVLRLCELANLYDKPIDEATWQAIRADLLPRAHYEEAQPLPREVAERFWALLAWPARLGELLRKLHELRVLEQLVPGMRHARGLLQFNAYHRYTVDEHSLRVVEYLTSLQGDADVPGQVYRAIRSKAILHLAALVHDLGKGHAEDHCLVGARLAEQAAWRLHLSATDAEILRFLVQHHLRMSHLAQQQDIHDAQVVVAFAVEVGSPEVLQMLYVLTLADLAAVGPGVLNQWKRQLLTELYQHALELLTSESPAEAASHRVRQRREEILTLVRRREGLAWWETQVISLPASSLFAVPPAQLVEELDRMRRLSRREAVAWGRYCDSRQAVEYTVGTYEQITPGIFHKLTGALTSQRQQILAADINTLADGLVLDRFYVQDQDYSGPPPPQRLDEICKSLVAALTDHADKPPVFRRLWQSRASAPSSTRHLPTRVTFDNRTAEKFTILATFAYDRMGLLYAITRTLFELGLSVSKAKIGTHLDQVVDVFYVTDQASGQKITDPARLAEIRQRLLAAIEAVGQEGS
jgi:[protein-PII] uridylyltransferase